MTRLSQLFLTALAVVGTIADHVVDLTPKNFDEEVFKSGRPALVEFFAPWCGHCKNLAPTYETFAEAFAHQSDKILIAKVDADAHKDLGKRFGVQGFPTLKWFNGKSKEPEEYGGGRELSDFVEFISEKTGLKHREKKKPASLVVQLDDSTFNKTVDGSKHVMVAFTAPWCGHCKSMKPEYENLAVTFGQEDDIIIAQVDAEHPGSKLVAAEHEITSFPTIKFFAQGSKEPVLYDGTRHELPMMHWLNEKCGTHRISGGMVDLEGGTIPALDAIINKAVAAKDGLAGGLSELKKAAEKEKGALAKYYIKAVEKSIAKAEYYKKEINRLQGIIDKGNYDLKKRDDLFMRRNILMKIEAAYEALKKGTEEKSEL